MNLETLLKENKELNDVYRGLDVTTDIEEGLDEFNAGYLAGYRGAMMATFGGFLDILIDIKNDVKHDGSSCIWCDKAEQ